VFAGPLVSWISRWRVSVDAATASLLMMFAATGVFVWRASQPLVRVLWPAAAVPRPTSEQRRTIRSGHER
jgi:hypothetical protein